MSNTECNNGAESISPVTLLEAAPVMIRRSRGRPRKVEPALPEAGNLGYHRVRMGERQRFIEGDDLVCAVESRVGSQEVLRLVVKALADEAASLLYFRREAERLG